jgi:hypothetical protein
MVIFFDKTDFLGKKYPWESLGDFILILMVYEIDFCLTWAKKKNMPIFGYVIFFFGKGGKKWKVFLKVRVFF